MSSNLAKGITPKKIWARAPNTPNNYDYALKIWTANNPNCEQKWSWHVAPLIEVSVGNVIEEYVIDPSIFDALATRSAWELVVTATHNVTGQTKPAIHTVSSWTQYQFDDPNFPNNPKLISPYAFNTPDPWLEADLTNARANLQNRFPYPPYSACKPQPNVFIRQYLADDGIRPTGINPWSLNDLVVSPDINYFPWKLADPTSSLGNVAPFGPNHLSHPLYEGTTAYIYFRLQNRGVTSAAARVNLYVSTVNGLWSPDAWTLAGSLTNELVAPEEFRVVGPIEWSGLSVPPSGEYRFIAIIGTAGDPEPNIGKLSGFAQIEAFIQENNNVACVAFKVLRPDDVYIRDNLSDVGMSQPTSAPLSMSPDINHYQQELAKPQEILAIPAAQIREDLFQPIKAGQMNYIYLRLQNRGDAPGIVDADLYYTPPSTLPTPASWIKIGSLVNQLVTPSEFRVVGPILWNAPPQAGHYCFVAVLGTIGDPKPDVSNIKTIDDYHTLVRQNNNVAWKNFEILNSAPSLGNHLKIKFVFEFLVQGWDEGEFVGDLEIQLGKLPKGTEVQLRVAAALANEARSYRLEHLRSQGRQTLFSVAPFKDSALRDIRLKPGLRSPTSLTINFPPDARPGSYDIAVLQKIDGKEVGRVTRRLIIAPKNRKTKESKRASVTKSR